ncbi:uncharacterized protein [Drosophila tropicalis]|uniref:uncharacterized protein n=1 Tax=Drosophila tropicalis TaxID=46794 RepID=UPI0035AB8A52
MSTQRKELQKKNQKDKRQPYSSRMSMCYCRGHKSNGRSDVHSLASSCAPSRQSSQHLPTTQFVKKPSLKTGLGLGHSRSDLSPNYSRRNSVVSHCSSCSCSSSPIQQQQRQQSRNKVLTWGWEREELSEGINTQYTDNRRLYEQSACVANRLPMTLNQGQCQGRSPTPSVLTSKSKSDMNDGLHQLRSLQQFRLSNAMDCFSEKRQDELRLQQAYDKLDTNKWQKNKANISRQQAKLTEPTTTAPYAWRQKLLQWQLQREAQDVDGGVGSRLTCAPLEKSCALRYNCY